MQFTLVFESEEGQNLSYLLCFIPCPVWKKGDAEIINLHSDNPHYNSGDLQTLLKAEQISASKKVVLSIHRSGHGSEQDLTLLLDDMKTVLSRFQIIDFRQD